MFQAHFVVTSRVMRTLFNTHTQTSFIVLTPWLKFMSHSNRPASGKRTRRDSSVFWRLRAELLATCPNKSAQTAFPFILWPPQNKISQINMSDFCKIRPFVLYYICNTNSTQYLFNYFLY